MDELVREQRRTNELLQRIANSLTERQLAANPLLGNGLGNDFPARISQTIESVATPSKMELAIQWLKEHPEDMALTGRDLEAVRRPMDVRISYRTWNDAKKSIQE